MPANKPPQRSRRVASITRNRSVRSSGARPRRRLTARPSRGVTRKSARASLLHVRETCVSNSVKAWLVLHRSSFFALCSVFAAQLYAHDLVIPVVTGTVPGRIFSTTVVVKNTSAAEARCTFTYRGPASVDEPLISNETIAAGKTNVYEDFLSEIAAVGTIR